jgi:hypothetical protein
MYKYVSIYLSYRIGSCSNYQSYQENKRDELEREVLEMEGLEREGLKRECEKELFFE